MKLQFPGMPSGGRHQSSSKEFLRMIHKIEEGATDDVWRTVEGLIFVRIAAE